MRVQCDVCETAQATLICCADEAALCANCDARVHAANKLAGKHQRLPLIYPGNDPHDSPSCDICQDKTGFFFCVEDRALLCRDCDYSIHSHNTLSSKHNRFLITGIRVALQPLPCNESRNSESNHASSCSPSRHPSLQTAAMSPKQASSKSSPTLVLQQASPQAFKPALKEQVSATISSSPGMDEVVPGQTVSKSSQPSPLPPSAVSSRVQQVPFTSGKTLTDWETHTATMGEMLPQRANIPWPSVNSKGGGGFVRRSPISEYLTETIPSWKVEEILSLPDMAMYQDYTDSGTSKTDAPNFGDLDWADCNAVDEQLMLGDAPGEVPSIPSPPTASGLSRTGRIWGLTKGAKKRPDPSYLFDDEDTLLVVPDIGGVTSPPSLSPSPPHKRSRIYLCDD